MSTNGVPTFVSEPKTKLDLARERKAAKQDARRLELEARELAELELEEALEEKGIGKRGVDFEIIDTEIGLFAVRKPEYVVAKKFLALEKRGDEEAAQFVSPCVIQPDQATFRAAIISHGGVMWRLANALLALYEARATDARGKF